MSDQMIYVLCDRSTLMKLMENYYESTDGDTIIVPEDFYYAILLELHELSAASHLPPDINTRMTWKGKAIKYVQADSDTSTE